MFDLVSDVGCYPEFLPWCSRAKVGVLQHGGNGKAFFDAELYVSYKMLSERFVSRVFLERDDLRIEIAYLDGPFRYLSNRWRFIAKEENGVKGVEVNFFIEFEFRSRMLHYLATPIFSEVVRRMTTAFARRAKELYGEKGAMVSVPR